MVMDATNGAMAATTRGVLRMEFLRAKDLTSMQTTRKLILASLNGESWMVLAQKLLRMAKFLWELSKMGASTDRG